MENIIVFLKKYKLYIVTILLFISFFRGCKNSRTINKLEKSEKINIEKIDSLINIINTQDILIQTFPDIIKQKKLSIYLEIDDKISRLDRVPQMMRLHTTIKDSIIVLKKE